MCAGLGETRNGSRANSSCLCVSTMVNCAVYGCKSKSWTKRNDACANATPVKFYSVPTVVRGQCTRTRQVSTRRRAEWFRRLHRADIDTTARHYKVCSKHFVSGRPSYLMDETNVDWAPSLFLGYNTHPVEARSQKRFSKFLETTGHRARGTQPGRRKEICMKRTPATEKQKARKGQHKKQLKEDSAEGSASKAHCGPFAGASTRRDDQLLAMFAFYLDHNYSCQGGELPHSYCADFKAGSVDVETQCTLKKKHRSVQVTMEPRRRAAGTQT